MKGLSFFMLMEGFNLMENSALCVKPCNVSLRESSQKAER